MDIAVLIKQVPVSNDVSVDPETHALIRSSSEGMINPADLNAIEAAMVLKEQTGGKVAVFTMGPTDAEKALRDAMACLLYTSCLSHFYFFITRFIYHLHEGLFPAAPCTPVRYPVPL